MSTAKRFNVSVVLKPVVNAMLEELMEMTGESKSEAIREAIRLRHQKLTKEVEATARELRVAV